MKWLTDYFNLSKGEKRGFSVLMGVVVLLLGLPYVLPFWVQDRRDPAIGDFNKAIIKYETNVAAMDTVGKEEGDAPKQRIEYFDFNPNDLPVEGWLKLGLEEKTAHIIDNYREAGGEFRKKSDLKSIYGFHDSTYKRLKPYIQLPEKAHSKPRNSSVQNPSKTIGPDQSEGMQASSSPNPSASESQSTKSESKTSNKVAINQADTTALKKIYGVGSVYSERLVKYRQLLGGFHQKSQLLEIYGLDSAQYEQIATQVVVNDDELNKISLNKANFKTLQEHPYLEYADVLALVNYREEVDSIKAVDELLNQQIIGQKQFEKISPYLTP